MEPTREAFGLLCCRTRTRRGTAQTKRVRRGTSATHARDYQQTRPTSYTRRRSSPGVRAQHPTVRGAASGGLCAARVGHMYGKIEQSPSLFRGRLCAARGRAGTALRGFFVAAAQAAKQQQPTAQKASVKPPQESKGLLAARLRSVREPTDASFGVSRRVRGARGAKTGMSL